MVTMRHGKKRIMITISVDTAEKLEMLVKKFPDCTKSTLIANMIQIAAQGNCPALSVEVFGTKK